MKDDSNEVLIAGIVVAFFVVAIIAGIEFESYAAQLVAWGILVDGADVLIPLGFGVGLDLVRLIIVVAVVLALVVAVGLSVSAARRRGGDSS